VVPKNISKAKSNKRLPTHSSKMMIAKNDKEKHLKHKTLRPSRRIFFAPFAVKKTAFFSQFPYPELR
jgi:hypothetical protein